MHGGGTNTSSKPNSPRNLRHGRTTRAALAQRRADAKLARQVKALVRAEIESATPKRPRGRPRKRQPIEA
jgi:hypothetical protein